MLEKCKCVRPANNNSCRRAIHVSARGAVELSVTFFIGHARPLCVEQAIKTMAVLQEMFCPVEADRPVELLLLCNSNLLLKQVCQCMATCVVCAYWPCHLCGSNL